jgi:predicted MPP superfamily phosphohydrolase
MPTSEPEAGKKPVSKISRRGFLKVLRNVTLFTVLTSIPAYQYSFNIEPKWLYTKTVAIPINDLPSSLEGFRIVQLSDIHHHPDTEIDTVIKAVERINALDPDLVAITGDYVYGKAEAIFELAPVLAEVRARYGTYSILGNHDYWTDPGTVQEGLLGVGIPVLINQGVLIEVGGGKLHIAGLDDGWEGSPDLDAAMETSISGVPSILLLHEPDFISETAKDHRITLQLSGHTHGGQVRIPGFGAPILPLYGRMYDYGLYRVEEAWLYVNPGIGIIPPRVRFNCRPEITEIILTRGG